MMFDLVIVVGFILACVIMFVASERSEKKDGKYDERQLLLQSKGRKYSLYTQSIVLGACSLATDFGLLKLFSPAFTMFFALAVGITVFVVYCVWKNVYISFRKDHKGAFILTLLLFVLYFFTSANYLRRGDWMENGQVTLSSGMPFLMAAALGTVVLVAVLRWICDGKNKAEDDEDE